MQRHARTGQRGVRSFGSYAIAIFAVMGLAGCTPTNIAQNVIANRHEIARNLNQPFAVHSARNTYLLRSGEVFYPSTGPLPAGLPELTDDQRKALKQILLIELQNIKAVQVRHAALLAQKFPGHDATRVQIALDMSENDRPFAVSDATSGAVTVDAKVVQAIFRAAIIATYADDPDHPLESAQQAIAFKHFQAFRYSLGDLPSLALKTDVEALAKGDPMQMLNQRLAQAGVMLDSKMLEARFLNAIRFMLAHEAGHVALDHSVSPTTCDEAQRNEATADRYAVLVSALSAYDQAKPIVVKKGSSQMFWSQITPLEETILAAPDGASEFFDFAYTLAGFDLKLSALPGCAYPTSAARAEILKPYSNAYFMVFDNAQDNEALRRFGSSEAKRELREDPFPHFFTVMPTLIDMNNQSLDQNKTLPKDMDAEKPALSEIYHVAYGVH